MNDVGKEDQRQLETGDLEGRTLYEGGVLVKDSSSRY